jgi:SAM-dependent methyltransferase
MISPASLALSAGYVIAQHLVGADVVRRRSIEALAPRPGDRVLDVGCGPAYYLGELPPCRYHGFDTDRDHIALARRRFGHRAEFHDEAYTERHREALAPFDRVLLMGLLHHLDDAACDGLLDLVARSLAPGGRVVSLDTVLFPGQSALSRRLAKNDQGDFVRYPEGFEAIARRHFRSVEGRRVGDTWRVPSAHYMMVLASPLRAEERAADPAALRATG